MCLETVCASAEETVTLLPTYCTGICVLGRVGLLKEQTIGFVKTDSPAGSGKVLYRKVAQQMGDEISFIAIKCYSSSEKNYMVCCSLQILDEWDH